MDEKDVCCVSCSGASNVWQIANRLMIGLERRNKGNVTFLLELVRGFQNLLKA